MPHRKPARRVARVPPSAAGLLVACLLATALLAALVHVTAVRSDRQRLRNRVEGTLDRIQNRLDAYLGVLAATRALVAAHPDLDAGAFRAFVAQLALDARYPGIQGVGFSLRVPADEREVVESTLRAHGQPDFRIWPDDPRDELHTIAFLEPLDRRNHAAIGYDMFTDPVRREAMERARDTGEAAASGRVTLVQEIDEHKQAGFLIYLPVYRGHTTPATVAERRAALVGFTYAPFRMEDLLAGIFGLERTPRVAFAVSDGAVGDDAHPPARHLMYRSPGFLEANPALAHDVERINVAGRPWTVHFRSLPTFERDSRRMLTPWVLGGGLVLSLVVFAVALARSRTRERLHLQARILESMSEGVSVTDESGTIVWTNPAEDRMFGYPPGGLIGRHVSEQNAGDPAARQRIVDGIVAALRTDGVWTGEIANVRADGTPFVTAARISAFEVGGAPYWICVQGDITERKHTETERGELLARERAARTEAEAANRAKDDFLAMLGHELRNPLAPIVTAVHVLRLRGVAAAELTLIERQLEHLVQLVDDLLDVSRIARGKIVIARRPVRLDRVVAQAVETASPLLEQHRHQLTIDVGAECTVPGDELRLAQIVSNLLTNAAKYTPPEGRIHVAARREGGEVVLRVRDSGIGIPAELLPRIFDLFTQGYRALDRSEGGLGIGLALVRRLVEAHGGRVSATSPGRNQGSEFTVRLPALDVAVLAPDGAPPPLPRLAPAPRRVLVVDDNADAAEALAGLLRAVGHDVALAPDGPRAIEVARTFHPEVAVLDIGLPVMDGYELAGLLQREVRPRLIALTGYGQAHDRARARAAGFAHHLVKPVVPERLLAAIDGTLAEATE